MSDAIAQMLRDLTADPNVGVDATWISAAGGPPRTIRVVPSNPSEAIPGLGAAGARGIAARVTMAADALPSPPQHGDLLAYGGGNYVVERADPDPRGASFFLLLKA
ncbi:head-tail joining protein [Falsiroseomonas selenitidurans]|uniref:Uncharacterized protein n=1 Tax=Falsiroseomonas selenitidurans TaxID=2716335 RepID=A0ABX1E8E1_9PROT|nr:hypothetical protein [Falsiroseomonas selenitidurans]NKC33494.1 hypothetical protein [Falsiroseomonas selenitidurans]